MIGRILLSIWTWLMLVLWFSAIIAAGVSAAGVFATLPDLHPVLPGFDALPEADHGRLASGFITEPIFTGTDIAQVVFSTLVLVFVFLHWLLGVGAHRAIARLTWTISTLVAAVLLWIRILLVMPGMNRDLNAYREAARLGDIEAASASQAAFNSMHPTASNLMEITALLLLLAIATLAIMSVPRHAVEAP